MSSTLRILSHSPEETQEVGRIIGAQARQGDIFLLTGPLGAGKTCLTQGIAWGLGVTEYARSPTFVLMTRYRGRLPLYHVDLYRINDPLEAWDLGLEEQLFGDGVCVVEWADRAREIFPENSLWIALDYVYPVGASPPSQPFGKLRAGSSPIEGEGERLPGERGRTITLVEVPPRYAGLLEKVAEAFPTVAVPVRHSERREESKG
jgi:tRNA threonylcarbamoyladenosine biosynthesis protein TsaE